MFDNLLIVLVQCPIKTCPFRTGLARSSKQLHTHTALPWVFSNTPAKSEVDWMNSCQDNQRKDRQTDVPSMKICKRQIF